MADLDAFDSIKGAIAFSVTDWSAYYRHQWLWYIVFGIDDDEQWECSEKKFGWHDDQRKKLEQYHEQFEKACRKPKPQRYKENDIFHMPFCPNEKCDVVMKKEWHFCPYCGHPMEWNEELDRMVNADADPLG